MSLLEPFPPMCTIPEARSIIGTTSPELTAFSPNAYIKFFTIPRPRGLVSTRNLFERAYVAAVPISAVYALNISGMGIIEARFITLPVI